MKTTTVRIDSETHARLVELSASAGSSLTATVAAAAEALRRQMFAHQVAVELEALRAEPEEWSTYVAEADATSVTDGVG